MAALHVDGISLLCFSSLFSVFVLHLAGYYRVLSDTFELKVVEMSKMLHSCFYQPHNPSPGDDQQKCPSSQGQQSGCLPCVFADVCLSEHLYFLSRLWSLLPLAQLLPAAFLLLNQGQWMSFALLRVPRGRRSGCLGL